MKHKVSIFGTSSESFKQRSTLKWLFWLQNFQMNSLISREGHFFIKKKCAAQKQSLLQKVAQSYVLGHNK